jgi:DnaD/phage-associated family protein
VIILIQPVGYFKIWRELFTKPIWLNSTPEQKTILITLLAMANYREKKWEWQGKPFECQPGQFITSLDSIQENCGQGVTIQNIRTALKRFEKLEFLTNQSTKTGRLITILNWELYQGDNEELNKDTNKDLTKTQQTANKQLTSREESKEVKKYIEEVVEEPEPIGKVYQFYQQNIGVITPFQAETIGQYLDEGMEPEMIIAVMQDSLGKSNPWSWIKKVLENSDKNNIKTLAQYEAKKVEKENKKNCDISKSQSKVSSSQTEMLQRVREKIKGVQQQRW